MKAGQQRPKNWRELSFSGSFLVLFLCSKTSICFFWSDPCLELCLYLTLYLKFLDIFALFQQHHFFNILRQIFKDGIWSYEMQAGQQQPFLDEISPYVILFENLVKHFSDIAQTLKHVWHIMPFYVFFLCSKATCFNWQYL